MKATTGNIGGKNVAMACLYHAYEKGLGTNLTFVRA